MTIASPSMNRTYLSHKGVFLHRPALPRLPWPGNFGALPRYGPFDFAGSGGTEGSGFGAADQESYKMRVASN
jgi:hypothetical protein